jgi:hypothetical protein
MDDYQRWQVETLRRSLAMIPHTQSTTTVRIEEVARIICELQRLDERDRRVSELVAELGKVLGDEG